MKKLIFIIIPLIAFGFLLAVFYIPGSQETTSASNPDNPGDPSVIDSFTNTNMISSHEYLIVDTTAGQVKLSDVCYGIADNTQVPGCNEVCQACQTGACGVATAGTDCGTCVKCNASGVCNNYYGSGTQDTTVPGTCSATHYRCNGSGNCTAPLDGNVCSGCATENYKNGWQQCYAAGYPGCVASYISSNCTGSSFGCGWTCIVRNSYLCKKYLYD